MAEMVGDLLQGEASMQKPAGTRMPETMRQLRALAVTTAARSDALPNTPAVALARSAMARLLPIFIDPGTPMISMAYIASATARELAALWLAVRAALGAKPVQWSACGPRFSSQDRIPALSAAVASVL
jgi:hypothetical protein